jgi:DNA-directed RNA polymerase subunit M/transcription elongation factor TFIIS
MASTVTIICPECEKQLMAPTDILGKKIRCKGCGATFSARAAAGKDAAKPAKGAKGAKVEVEEEGAYGVTHEYMGARCPYCANAMDSDDAIICLHCGYNTQTRQFVKTRKVVDQTGMDIFLWLLPGILCALVAIGMIVFDILYCVFIDDWIDGETWYGSMLVWKGTKIWLCVISDYFIYLAAKFAVKRLAIDNKPPEIEEKL